MKDSRRPKSIFILGIVFGVASLSIVAWFVFGSNRLKASARAMVNAMRDGNGQELYNAASAREISCSGLTAENLEKAWHILIEPRIKSSKFVRAEAPEQTSNEYQATSSIWYTDKFGNPWRLVMIANRTEDGPKTTVLFHLLSLASLFDEKEEVSTGQTIETELRGIKRYRIELENIGIRKVMLNPQVCLSWSEYEALLLKKKGLRTNSN